MQRRWLMWRIIGDWWQSLATKSTNLKTFHITFSFNIKQHSICSIVAGTSYISYILSLVTKMIFHSCWEDGGWWWGLRSLCSAQICVAASAAATGKVLNSLPAAALLSVAPFAAARRPGGGSFGRHRSWILGQRCLWTVELPRNNSHPSLAFLTCPSDSDVDEPQMLHPSLLLLLFLLWRAAAVAPARAWRERWMGFPHPSLPPSPPPPFPPSSRFYHTFQVHAMEPLLSWKSSDWWMFLKYKLASNISYRTWGLM